MAGRRRGVSRRQHRAIERAVDEAERTTGLQLCVYLGPTEGDPRAHAERLFVEAGLEVRPAVLLLVSPPDRRVEVLTAPAVRNRITDEDCARAVEEMSPLFASGDLAGGIETGLRHLAGVAGPGVAPPGDEELPDVLGE